MFNFQLLALGAIHMRIRTRAFAPIALVGVALLCGCSQTNPTFESMSQSYQRTLEKYDRNSLLLNIVRASKEFPLNFLAVPSITGTGSISGNVGIYASVISNVPGEVNGFFSAGVGSGFTPSANVSLGRSFSFSQSSLDNASFQHAFMSEIPLSAVHLVDKDLGDRELIYSLAVQSIQIREPDGRIRQHHNSPRALGYADFQQALHDLVTDGLTTEILVSYEPVGTPMTPAQVNSTLFNFMQLKTENKLSIKDVSPGQQKKLFQMFQQNSETRFCVTRTPQREAELRAKYGEDFLCHDVLSQRGRSGDEKTPGAKPSEQVSLQLRSTKDVFSYLGAVMAVQMGPNPRIPMAVPRVVLASGEVRTAEPQAILLVKTGGYAGSAFSDSAFSEVEYEGVTYSIPAENSGYSTKTISILTGLLAMDKVPGSIPQSPTVLIK